MKVAIPSTGEDLSASVDQRFGRCARFLFVDSETMEYRAVPNQAAAQPGGAGIAAAQQIIDEGAEVVLAGEIGPNAFDVMSHAGIRVYARITGTVRDAVEMLRSGALENTKQATGPARHERGGGRGMGMGRGMGRGMGGGRGGP